MTDKTEYDTCGRCGRDALPEHTTSVELMELWTLCEGCVERLEQDITHNDWSDRYTEEQHERAVSLLSDMDEIECVISDHEQATIIVHTPYVSSDVVVDHCRHFGFRIMDYRPMWSMESDWPCVPDHGDTFQVTLKYLPDSPMPSLLDAKFTESCIENLEDTDKQF